MQMLYFLEVQRIQVNKKLRIVGFSIILENLRNQQRKIKAKRIPGLTVKLIETIVLSEEKVKNQFSSTAFYEFDPSNSHSSLMFEGLTVKFTNSFFK